MNKQLMVSLHTECVGYLSLLPGERIIFTFVDDYIENPLRPTLSQSFYNQFKELMLEQRPTQRKAPPFFANLLPEGHLRQYLADKAGINPERDFGLLGVLGDDLAGAVRIHEVEAPELILDAGEPLVAASLADDALHFSLAGVQLKFSALFEAPSGLTIPAHGVGGDWIVKLPSLRFPHVPENEFAMMRLAALSGLDVPEVKLLEFDAIEGLEAFSEFHGQRVLAVKRFDRNLQNAVSRIHIEDLAQVFGVYPHNKYHKVSYNNIAANLNRVIGTEGLNEFIKRLVFNLIIGNGDCHLKNISLIYPDGINPQLAPAYDLVSTSVYLQNDQQALSFYGTKQWRVDDKELWSRLASDLELDKVQLIEMIAEFHLNVLQQWRDSEFDLPDKLRSKLITQLN